MMRSNLLMKRFSTSLTQYLTPFTLKTIEQQDMPTLKLKSEKEILRNWWSVAPFEGETDLKVPVFNFESNEYTGKSVELPKEIFNQPLRRDLIYRLHHYRLLLNKFRTKMTRNRAMTSGSGAKMKPQKKTGSARMGDKRAPHLKKGGKAHGSKPKVYTIDLNAKIKLKALHSLLTAKLVEGKIKIIDSENVAEPKTKIVQKIIDLHVDDDRAIFCFITSSNVDENFELAQRSIKRVIFHTPYDLDVKSLFIADKIYLTLNGLEELISNLRKTKYVIYKQPYMPEIEQQQKEEEEIVRWDPEKPYEFKFRILADYLDLYEKVKVESPELLQNELQKVRKIELLN